MYYYSNLNVALDYFKVRYTCCFNRLHILYRFYRKLRSIFYFPSLLLYFFCCYIYFYIYHKPQHTHFFSKQSSLRNFQEVFCIYPHMCNFQCSLSLGVGLHFHSKSFSFFSFPCLPRSVLVLMFASACGVLPNVAHQVFLAFCFQSAISPSYDSQAHVASFIYKLIQTGSCQVHRITAVKQQVSRKCCKL